MKRKGLCQTSHSYSRPQLINPVFCSISVKCSDNDLALEFSRLIAARINKAAVNARITDSWRLLVIQMIYHAFNLSVASMYFFYAILKTSKRRIMPGTESIRKNVTKNVYTDIDIYTDIFSEIWKFYST